jgi:hypothetical protein
MIFEDEPGEHGKSLRCILIHCTRQISIALLLLLLPLTSGLMNASSDLGPDSDILINNSSIENASLWQIFEIIKSKETVDLTHSFGPGIPHWDGFPNETVEILFNFSSSGFLAQSSPLQDNGVPMLMLRRIFIRESAQLIK